MTVLARDQKNVCQCFRADAGNVIVDVFAAAAMSSD
jgi:hypothetical protein